MCSIYMYMPIAPHSVLHRMQVGVEDGHARIAYWMSFNRTEMVVKYGKGYHMEETTLLTHNFLGDVDPRFAKQSVPPPPPPPRPTAAPMHCACHLQAYTHTRGCFCPMLVLRSHLHPSLCVRVLTADLQANAMISAWEMHRTYTSYAGEAYAGEADFNRVSINVQC